MSHFTFSLIDLLWTNFFTQNAYSRNASSINWLLSRATGVHLKGIPVYKIYTNVTFICKAWLLIVKKYMVDLILQYVYWKREK